MKKIKMFFGLFSALCLLVLFQNMTTVNNDDEIQIISNVWKVEHIWGQPRLTVWYRTVPGFPQSAKISLLIQDRINKIYYRYNGDGADMLKYTQFQPMPVYIDADSFLLIFLSKQRDFLKAYKVSRSRGKISPLWVHKLPRAVTTSEWSGAMHKSIEISKVSETIMLRVGTLSVQGVETKSLFNMKDIRGCHTLDQHSEILGGKMTCVANERVCKIAHGTGYQEWDRQLGVNGEWRRCKATACDEGYAGRGSMQCSPQ